MTITKPSKIMMFFVCLILLYCGKNDTETTQTFDYPKTTKTSHTDEYHGVPVEDPYHWLEDDLSKDTEAWVKAQNEVTFSYLEELPYRKEIYERLSKIYNYQRVYKPIKHGDYYYFYKNDGLQDQNVLYRTRNLEDETSYSVFLDPNTFSEDGTIAITTTSFTKNAKYMAYFITEGGSDWRKAIVIDTETGEKIGEPLENIKFSALAWRGTEGFYYSSYDAPEEGSKLSGKTAHHKLYFHKLNTPQSEDELIFGGEQQPRRYVWGYLTEDERFLIIGAANSTSGNELYIQDLTDPNSEIQPMALGFEHEHYVVDNVDDRLIIHTNMDAPNNRLMNASISNPSMTNWTPLINETESVMQASIGGKKLFLEYIVDARSELHQYDRNGKHEHEIELPQIGNVSGFNGRENETIIYYYFTSFTYPLSIFKYDITTHTSTLYRTPQIDFDPTNYTTDQVFYKSKDGTSIPMFIVYKKGMKKDGKNPTYLYGYGGFNISLLPSFSTTRIVWLENGGIYAQPNIRGGGEYGEKWHKAGTKLQKQNVFDDFMAAAEYLIENQYTSSERLAIAGGSNGGLLVGAVMTQQPELARVALPAVGVMDMLRYNKFTAGAGWATDYGTAEDSKEMFEYLYRYSPYHALKENVNYPATLITTADHDDRVVPAHSFKFASRLQEYHKGDAPVLIRIEVKAGHGSGKPISKILDEWADKYAFTWHNMKYLPPEFQVGK